MLSMVLQKTVSVAYSVSAPNSWAIMAVFTAVGKLVLRIIESRTGPSN
jgi:hypothetical protein